MKLLLEQEVADILRCSRSKVKRLRLTGRLSYVVGTPVLIAEEDLQAYIETEKRRRAEIEERRKVSGSTAPQDPYIWAKTQILLARRK